ncbi:Hypothetical predicted protein [Mytilus galloprovincialis]|uniref:HYR domain-containing protein n=1 Tax=Mytilus galloprovincialis TaxID=29158 RepID=A0A8B6GTH2_MYTGA|nr:Hypothetical predicted protein [Mytilus galloprovincialis]
MDTKEPQFLVCPRQGHKVNIYIKPSINHAELYLPLTVIDWKGDQLETTLSKTNFSRCKCAGPQEEIVHVTAVDEFGNEAECRFTVSVIDVSPPVFIYCPERQTRNENDNIVWKTAEIRDNVGIKSLSTPDRYYNTKFPPGLYSLVYNATDYSGNSATCRFEVNVYSTTYSQKYEKNTDPSIVISSAIVGALFIILIMMALGIYRLYTKRRQLNSQRRHQLYNTGCRQLDSSGQHQLNNPERQQVNSSRHNQPHNPEHQQVNSSRHNQPQNQEHHQDSSTSRLSIVGDPDLITSQRETHDNPVFTIYNDDPPPYEIAAFDKLPDYSPATFPPSYEAVQSLIEFTDNPITEIPQLEPSQRSSITQSNVDYSRECNAEIPVNTVSEEVQDNTSVQQFLERDLHLTAHVNMQSDHVHFQINSNSIHTDV